MVDRITHPFDVWRKEWKTARRRAAAGSKADAIFSLIILFSFFDANVVNDEDSTPPGLPHWLLDDISKIFGPAMRDGASLDKAFHLRRERGRALIDNAQRDMEIDALSGGFQTLEAFADAAERLGLPPPRPGEVWTADALAKAMKAHANRIKSGLLFHSEDE